MHLHVLGICGTFMGGIAQLALAAGHTVTGCDQDVYPPMSDQLERAGVTLLKGYEHDPGRIGADLYVIGNALSRGNPLVEAILNRRLPYTSGPAWLGETLLGSRTVAAVAGTHGKTTTSAMLAWILERAGREPGFLIGGVPGNFEGSARIGDGEVFVIEADEYDTAFFDKRSKFVHYHADVCVLNNLEFDHADIFDSLDDIKRQFHHLMRTVPGNGKVIYNADDDNLSAVLAMGCWTGTVPFTPKGAAIDDAFSLTMDTGDGSGFSIVTPQSERSAIRWPLFGAHNAANALAAVAAAAALGVHAGESCAALGEFAPSKRRMEKVFDADGITVFDDFAHHPSAIATTLAGLRARQPGDRILAVFEPRSNTMESGHHNAELCRSFEHADRLFVFDSPELEWSVAEVFAPRAADLVTGSRVADLGRAVVAAAQPGDHIVIMSNGGFGGMTGLISGELGKKTGSIELNGGLRF